METEIKYVLNIAKHSVLTSITLIKFCIRVLVFNIVFALFILHAFKLNWIIINYVKLYSLSTHTLFLIALEYKKHKHFFEPVLLLLFLLLMLLILLY